MDWCWLETVWYSNATAAAIELDVCATCGDVIRGFIGSEVYAVVGGVMLIQNIGGM